MKRTWAVILAVTFWAAFTAHPAGALFGIGDKNDEAKEEGAPAMGDLPGSEEAAPSVYAQPPKMAQETPETPEGKEGGEESPEPATRAETPTSSDAGAKPVPEGDMPAEVVIKGTGGGKLKANKPPLKIEVDPFDSNRESLKPDQALLLAESPLTVVWRRTHPEFLRSDRVIEPWRMTFSERAGIVFSPLKQLGEVLQKKVENKDSKDFEWMLTIADEEGKVFQQYSGSDYPPKEIVWNGQNDQGEWIRAGKAYSPVYVFTDKGGYPYTRAGEPIRFKGIVHQERDGVHVSLDSTILFGTDKAAKDPTKDGLGLLRASADLIKRRYSGTPIRVESYAGSKTLAETQAQAVENYLIQELMLLPQDIATDSLKTPYAEQRLEIILVNR